MVSEVQFPTNRRSTVNPDSSDLTTHAPAIEAEMARIAASIEPEEFTTLTGEAGFAVLRAAMTIARADSITVWLADTANEHLVVTHTEPDRNFKGFKLPTGEGLVGLCYASEQRLCENQVYQNQDHSKRVDEEFSQITYAMLATPFHIAGTLRGVLSCVQLKESIDAPDPSGFTARTMNRVGRLSIALERLVTHRLLVRTLGLEL